MTTTEKREIQYKLKIYVTNFTSQKKAVATIDGVSEATLISMLSEKETLWDKITDAMWRNVASQVGGIVDFNRLVETTNYTDLTTFFETAKQEGATFAVTGEAGWGKTYTAKWYAANHRKENVYLLECAEYWNKRTFVTILAAQIGKELWGMTLEQMMQTVVREIRRKEKPLIIIDEIDKLPDSVFKFFITLYNELNKICGFVWLSTDAIVKRMNTGLRKNYIGYKELYSRIGGNFIPLSQPTFDEVAEICHVNGIENKERVTIICNEVKDLGGDLRRVDRNILKEKVKRNRKSKAA
jgi:DNA transposition AAA+ family ATPase